MFLKIDSDRVQDELAGGTERLLQRLGPWLTHGSDQSMWERGLEKQSGLSLENGKKSVFQDKIHSWLKSVAKVAEHKEYI